MSLTEEKKLRFKAKLYEKAESQIAKKAKEGDVINDAEEKLFSFFICLLFSAS